MIDLPHTLTAQQFVEQKSRLPEGGRWHELHDGRTVLLSAPDDSHGNIVLNVSRALAAWMRLHAEHTTAYACHDVGIHVSSSPDTVYFPAISLFESGERFSQTDRVIATEIPRLVIDVASSNDRRTDMGRRVRAYMQRGVDIVWIPDPFKKEVQVLQNKGQTQALGAWQTITSPAVLPDFQLSVEAVFAQPSWWTK